MEGLLFALVIFVAVFVVAWKRWQKRRAYNAYKAEREAEEGHTPAHAYMIHHPDEIDKYVRRERCHCGGKVWNRAEASVEASRPLRVAVCECYRCEEVIRLYFEIDYLN